MFEKLLIWYCLDFCIEINYCCSDEVKGEEVSLVGSSLVSSVIITISLGFLGWLL